LRIQRLALLCAEFRRCAQGDEMISLRLAAITLTDDDSGIRWDLAETENLKTQSQPQDTHKNT